MASVTGYTATRIKEIEDNNIVSAVVDGAGHLILTKFDESTIDAGLVIGPEGDVGPTGPAASWAGYQEPFIDKGSVSGVVELDFDLSNNWLITPTGAITINFTNFPPAGYFQGGTIVFANSTYAITWPAGTKFPKGIAPILSGQTILSVLARNAYATVGVAWDLVA